jgi:UDP-N-acetylglucosamine:LPS N-acetylglucosamine transferase
VFAYLKRFKGQEELLEHLQKRECPTIIYLDATDKSLGRFECGTLRFARRRLDVAAVGRECDLAILNGGHGVTAEMLLAGKPILELPLAFEQRMIADAVVRLGAGASASIREPKGVMEKLDAILDEDRYEERAREFGERYGEFNGQRQREAMIGGAGELLAPARDVSALGEIGYITSR